MRMKVFNKGQVVIPAEIRKALGIKPGDSMEVSFDLEHRTIMLSQPQKGEAQALAGSLSAYAQGKQFPSRKEMHKALVQGMTNE
mgnify:FL=1